MNDALSIKKKLSSIVNSPINDHDDKNVNFHKITVADIEDGPAEIEQKLD
jgi:hypothetical protein